MPSSKQLSNKFSEKRKIVKKSFPVLKMSCAGCASNIQKMLKILPGVVDVSVNITDNMAHISFYPDTISITQLKEAVQAIGYDLIIEEGFDIQEKVDIEHKKVLKSLTKNTIGAAIPSVLLIIIAMFFEHMPYTNYIMWILATPVVFIFGRSFYINAWKQLKHRSANMDTLVALSTASAYLFSVFNTLFPGFWLNKGLEPHVYFEAAAVIIAFILLGRRMEEKAKSNTSSAIRKLMGLQPKTVTIEYTDNRQKEIPITEVKVGDVLLAKPGEKIAIDGTIVSGHSFIDESMISGEPIPVEKTAGDNVFAGTLNQQSSFKFRVDKIGSETLLAQIIHMVRNAQASKPPVQKLTDKIAGIFVPVIVVISIITLIIWLLSGIENAFTYGLMSMITVLVIACPCALGLATPTAVMVGIGKGAENGILIKNAESLESAKKVNIAIFDKTGTITEGKPEISDTYWLNNDLSMLPVFVNMERLSDHPLAKAVERYYKDVEILQNIHVENIVGKGLKAIVDGNTFFAGSKQLIQENNLQIDSGLLKFAEQLSNNANSMIWFGSKEKVLAIVGIADRIKATSVNAVKELKKMDIEIYMLTGDNLSTAISIANRAGIKNFRAEFSPIQKTEFVKELQEKGKIVAMVGDGINDSSALAQADVSIAMGKGSDIAMDVADITIISSDLEKVPQAIRLSRYTVRTIRQNLFWAFIYNLIGIPIAAGILYPINGFLLNPMIAAATMALSSVSVVTNSLRLKTKKIS